MSETAQAIRLADYKPYPATFHAARLSFDLGEESTLVEAEVDVAPTDPGQPLWFDGLDMELKAIWIDGVALREGTDYVLEATGLRLLKYPAQRFKLGIISQIKPQDNTKLEGLYKSSGNFCSQCEAEGFRHVVYWPDRSDVLTTFTVKIVADKKTYVVKKHPKRPELVERLHGVHGGHVKVKGKVTTTETGHEVVLEEIVTKPAAK